MKNSAVTTSIRLPPTLRASLEELAIQSGEGKNRIIINALSLYLSKMDEIHLKAEAQKQSRLAAASDRENWDDETDLSGWT